MENQNVLNGTQQTVVESAKDLNVNCGTVTGTPETGAKAEVADRRQSRSENSGFRKLRMENESYKKELEKLRGELSGLSELENLKKQNSAYLDKLVSDKMAADLEYIRKTDPTVTDLASLGEDFIRLIENGIDIKVAYSAVNQASQSSANAVPPVTGSVGSAQGRTSPYFTSKELDRLTARDLENPKIFKKAMESLKRL